jgi:uncharacterized membrane protein
MGNLLVWLLLSLLTLISAVSIIVAMLMVADAWRGRPWRQNQDKRCDTL